MWSDERELAAGPCDWESLVADSPVTQWGTPRWSRPACGAVINLATVENALLQNKTSSCFGTRLLLFYIFIGISVKPSLRVDNYSLCYPTSSMTSTDLEQLIEMGFEKERAELAVKNTGDRQ